MNTAALPRVETAASMSFFRAPGIEDRYKVTPNLGSPASNAERARLTPDDGVPARRPAGLDIQSNTNQ